jgi:hypothetical protein
LQEKVYVQIPKVVTAGRVVIVELLKALYGLCQAPNAWSEEWGHAMHELLFTPSEADPCIFFKGRGPDTVYLLVYVDDIIIAGSKTAVLLARDAIAARYKVKDAGEAQFFLSIHILRSSRGLLLSQEHYCRKVLEQFGFTDSTAGRHTPMALGTVLSKDGKQLPPINPYKSIVGSLLYLAVSTRPDISHAVGCLSKYMSAPTEQHLLAAKHVLRYLKEYPGMGLFYQFGPEGECEPHSGGKFSWYHANLDGPNVHPLEVYADADFGVDKDARKSISGMVTMWKQHPISWSSKQQSIATTSTTEAEFVATAAATKQGMWLRNLLCRPLKFARQFKLHCDNEAAISLVQNNTAGVSGRTKHIDIQYKFVRERYQRGELDIVYIHTSLQLADMFTKPLSTVVFQGHRTSIGMVSTQAFLDK